MTNPLFTQEIDPSQVHQAVIHALRTGDFSTLDDNPAARELLERWIKYMLNLPMDEPLPSHEICLQKTEELFNKKPLDIL